MGNKLPGWLESKNDFYEAKKLIDDFRIATYKAQVSKGEKKAFNDFKNK